MPSQYAKLASTPTLHLGPRPSYLKIPQPTPKLHVVSKALTVEKHTHANRHTSIAIHSSWNSLCW